MILKRWHLISQPQSKSLVLIMNLMGSMICLFNVQIEKEGTGNKPIVQKENTGSKVDVITERKETTTKINVQTERVSTSGKPNVQKKNTNGKPDIHIDKQTTTQTEKESTSTETNVHTEQENTSSRAIVQTEKGDMSNNPDYQLRRENTTEKVVESVEIMISSHLMIQYEQFSQQIGSQSNPQVEIMENQDMEIIPEHPTKEIMLKIEEIPPLDIFYSPKNRAVVKKQRKRRRTDQDSLSTSQVEFMNIVWKNAEVNPSDDLTKLSQYAGAYSATTIDKASEVTQMMKQKELQIAMLEEQATEKSQKIIQLEQQLKDEELRSKQLEEQLSIEKKKIDQQALNKQQNLCQEVVKLQVLLQNEKTTRIEQEKILQSKLDRFNDYLNWDQFKTGALETNKLLSHQLNELCQRMAQAEPLLSLIHI